MKDSGRISEMMETLKRPDGKKLLLQYVRDEDRNKIGCVVAVDKENIGWSRVHPYLDSFEKEMGLRVAIGRALKGTKRRTPPEVQQVIEKVQRRAEKYYK